MKNLVYKWLAAVSILIAGSILCAAQARPMSDAAMRKLTTVRKVVTVQPLSPAARLARVQQLLNVPNGKPATKPLIFLTGAVTLSVANAASGGNLLKFNLVDQVSPSENKALFAKRGSDVGLLIGFNAPSDGTYIFDFSAEVFDVGPGESPKTLHFYGLFNPTDQTQKIVTKPKDSHVIVVVQGVKAGGGYYFVNFDTAWEFYSVNISQLKS